MVIKYNKNGSIFTIDTSPFEREETTIYDEHAYTTYNNKNLILDYAKYEVSGTHDVDGEEENLPSQGNLNGSAELIIGGQESGFEKTKNRQGRNALYDNHLPRQRPNAVSLPGNV